MDDDSRDAAAGAAAPPEDALARVERAVILVLYAAMTAIGSLQVVNRYLLNLPIWNMELLLPHMFICVTFLGLSPAFRHRAHIAVELVPDALPAAVRRWYLLAVWLVVAVFLVGLAYSALLVALFQMRIDAVTNMGYPAVVLTACVPVGCALSLWRIAQVEVWPLLRGRRPGGGA